MSSRKIAQALLVCGWVLLPMTARGDTLSGVFATKDKTAAAGTNEACLVADGEFFSTFGIVTGTSNGCTAVISYETDSLNLVSLSPIKSGKSEGSARIASAYATIAMRTTCPERPKSLNAGPSITTTYEPAAMRMRSATTTIDAAETIASSALNADSRWLIFSSQ